MINAIFEGSSTAVSSSAAYIHDYGQKLRVIGLDLPEVVEAHFSLEETGQSVLSMGTYANEEAIIPIPDAMLAEHGHFFCYIFGRQTASGRTMYKIKIPVLKRADLPAETTNPTEDERAYFEDVLERLQDIIDSAGKSGGTEGYKVAFTATYNTQTAKFDVSCDRTLEEVREAVNGGAYVYGIADFNVPGNTYSVFLPLIECSSRDADFGIERPMLTRQTPQAPETWMLTVDIFRITAGDPDVVEYVSDHAQPATMLDVSNAVRGLVEGFEVTIRSSGPGVAGTCDRTFAEITAAINSGKHVYAVFYYDEDDPCVMPLAVVTAGQYVLFGGSYSYEPAPDTYSMYSEYACVNSDDTVYYLGRSTTQIPTQGQFSALEQRVAALEQSLNT